jgi:hypothetical protein
LNRSQRILIAIGLAALAAMAAPYITRAVVDDRAIAGKVQVFDAKSARANKELTLCLIRHPGALNLSVSSNDLYADPASGLAVRIDEEGQSRKVTAWLPKGGALTAEQTAQLEGCVG